MLGLKIDNFFNMHAIVAVTGRKRTLLCYYYLFLSLFDHFFEVLVVVSQSVSLPKSLNLLSSNSYLSARGTLTFGLYSQSIPLGELI